MKKFLAAFLVTVLSGVYVVTLFGDNLKALFGMSADCLAGDTVVERRTSKSQGKLEYKKLTNFAAENSGVYVEPAPVTRTTVDAFSTFAIDVDTASYTWARRTVLERSALPAADGIRLEEWVNAFDYALPAPESAPFAISVEGATSPFDEAKTLVKVGLQGRRVDEEQRKPAHLVFLVDVSGSMSGADRLPLAKRALEVLTRQLRPTDTVALVTYAGRAEVMLAPTSAAQQERILGAIHALETGGGTSMGSGMELAYKLAVGQVQRGTTTRVIVLTDGDTNIGPNLTPAQMLASVHAHVEEGVTLTTVGFGLGNYQGDALEQLADKGNGQALYVDSEQAIDKAFRQQLTGTLEVIAKDVKVQVTFDPKVVSSYRLLGYENRAIADADFRNDQGRRRRARLGPHRHRAVRGDAHLDRRGAGPGRGARQAAGLGRGVRGESAHRAGRGVALVRGCGGRSAVRFGRGAGRGHPAGERDRELELDGDRGPGGARGNGARRADRVRADDAARGGAEEPAGRAGWVLRQQRLLAPHPDPLPCRGEGDKVRGCSPSRSRSSSQLMLPPPTSFRT